jgi:hypothetical protein
LGGAFEISAKLSSAPPTAQARAAASGMVSDDLRCQLELNSQYYLAMVLIIRAYGGLETIIRPSYGEEKTERAH